MARVKALEPHLINVIAAGEVIDRPASIVKELVENALDAGARRVEIEVASGGTALVRVGDDGEGMAPEDLELAVRRHTTSKIASVADLEAIRTLGFRGEALASICEVARVRLSSRRHEDPEGTLLVIEGGTVRARRPVGRAPGTTVEVREVFFNVPARRKFLKSERTESLHIVRTVKRFLLSHPGVHLKLSQNGKVALESPASEDLLEIAVHLYGPRLARDLVPVTFQGQLLRVRGWVSTPQLTRSDRQEQHVFVNRRAVSDSLLHYVLGRAYEGKLTAGRHPYVCLHLQLDPREVDVNVHPQKHEVRFLQPQAVKRELLQALGQALVGVQAAPRLPWKQAEAALRHRPAAPGAPARRPDLRAELEALRPRPERLVEAETFRVVGQLHGTYIVVQTEEGFELIDQHVAAERVLYETLLEQLRAGGVRAQKLLVPETLQFSPEEARLLAERRETLERLGLELEPFGADTFVLRAWPQALAEHAGRGGYRPLLERLAARLAAEGKVDFADLAGTLAASLACEAAVVQHTPLPLEAMRELVRRLKATREPHHCPHGRPVSLKYDLVQLERAFKRR